MTKYIRNHTPTPWKVYYAKNNGQFVLGLGEKDGQAITNHSGAFWRDDNEARENSEFVCIAVNSFYQMKEALELAISKDMLSGETREKAIEAIQIAGGE